MASSSRHRPLGLAGRAALALALVLAVVAHPSRARADELTELARTMRTARQDKARLAAAVALSRLRDRRAVEPLLAALADASPLVRAVAATALGHLGDGKVLPALARLRDDRDPSVRKRAGEAIQMIEQRTPGRPGARARAENLPGRFKVAAREQPRLADDRPPMHVTIKTVSDRSTVPVTTVVRKRHADKLRSVLAAELDASPEVQLGVAAEPDPAAADRFSIDGTITRFQRRIRGPNVEILCEIQISVYNASGKMLSFVSGGAFVQVPAKTFQDQYEPAMRLEALESAVRGLHPNLIAYLNSERAR